MTDSEYYKAVWVNALQGILGWSRSRAVRWARRYAHWFDEPTGMVFHETPFHYILDEIMPIECSRRMAHDEIRDLKGRIEQMFLAREINQFADVSYDWTTLRDEIDELLLETCGCGMKRKGGSFWRSFAQPADDRDGTPT